MGNQGYSFPAALTWRAARVGRADVAPLVVAAATEAAAFPFLLRKADVGNQGFSGGGSVE